MAGTRGSNGNAPVQLSSFNSLLPQVIKLPYSGDYSKVKLIYNGENVLGYDGLKDKITLEIDNEINIVMAQGDAFRTEFDTIWNSSKRRHDAYRMSVQQRINQIRVLIFDEEDTNDPIGRLRKVKDYFLTGETDDPEDDYNAEEYTRAEQEYAEEMEPILVQMEELVAQKRRRLASWLVDGVEVWPFLNPPPEHDKPETFKLFNVAVLDWIIGYGRLEALRKIYDPNSTSRSNLTSLK